jgi:hypothetical protein
VRYWSYCFEYIIDGGRSALVAALQAPLRKKVQMEGHYSTIPNLGPVDDSVGKRFTFHSTKRTVKSYVTHSLSTVATLQR